MSERVWERLLSFRKIDLWGWVNGADINSNEDILGFVFHFVGRDAHLVGNLVLILTRLSVDDNENKACL